MSFRLLFNKFNFPILFALCLFSDWQTPAEQLEATKRDARAKDHGALQEHALTKAAKEHDEQPQLDGHVLVQNASIGAKGAQQVLVDEPIRVQLQVVQ